ncbi:glycoside hydrolase family 17 protein [Lentinula raphanica]|uniref:glucan endo-1,3-beta-D-glucosidase n=1 Tax=Lentinula raphanica TaxID=153919 RepID=A0AA38P9F5_9AGAR|nr:glycoside hydrolase family 17 protein [Lentinula raphanica]KAJ3838745.1 glycoside hydrolase family 17 protein [Lentinula raphanica]KAJ3975371.1 glycoside hydrolase family 17 protein [Lentinula raphanica]
MSRDLATPSSDLQDYYDHVPPAHRISNYSTLSGQQGQHIPLQAAASSSAVNLAEPYSDIPGALPARTRPHFGDRRGEFVDSPYVEEKSRSSGRKKWVLGGLIALVVVIVVAIVLGVVLSRKSSSSSSSSDDSISGDPSQFTKDSRLKQSFWGIAYTPEGTLYPDCGAKLSDVVTDIQLLSQLTTRIRVYGADCNTTALVLDAIQLTKVNMTVYIANYPESDDNGEAYDRQKSAIQSAIQTFGVDHIAGVTVGNEFILDYLDDNGGTDPNSAVGNAGAEILLGFINDTRSMLSDMSVSLKIGNADAGSYFNDMVLEDVDYGMANVHPWFANVSIDQAAGWTWNFFETTDVALAKSLSNDPEMSIAETGWPTNSTNAGNESNGPSTASEANLQTFLNTFVCQANANGTEYFFFEYFDETWKTEKYGGVEGYWGLFYSNRTLKNIEIPDCSS